MSTNEVGKAILPFLRDIDVIAYLRFASVYRAFDTLERAGAIRRTGKRIEVLSTAELEAAIETEPS